MRHAIDLSKIITPNPGAIYRVEISYPLTFLPAALETIDALDSWFTVVLPCILSLVILLPMILAAAVVQDPLTALIFLITVPIAPFLLYLIGQLTHSASERQWHELQQLSGGFQELLHCMLTLETIPSKHGLVIAPRAPHIVLENPRSAGG